MSENIKEYQNEKIEVKLTRNPGCIITLDVTLKPECVKEEYNKAKKAVSKEVSIPGFRKGKAPEKLIVDKFGSHIDSEWKRNVLSRSFSEAISLTKVYPLSDNAIRKADSITCSLEDGATTLYIYEAKPEIPQVDPTTCVLKETAIQEMSDEEVATTIEKMRTVKPMPRKIEGRSSIQEGDLVIVDLKPENDELIEEIEVLMKEDSVNKWIYDLLLGKELNAEVEGVSAPSEKQNEEDEDLSPESQDFNLYLYNYEDGEVIDDKENFTPKKFTLIVKNISETVYPEIDSEEFLKSHNVETVEQLKEKVKEGSVKRQEKEARDEQYRQARNWLIENHPFDLPYSIIEYLTKVIYDAKVQAAHEKGADHDHDQLLQSAKHEGEQYMTLNYLTKTIAKEKNLQPAQEEIAQALFGIQFRRFLQTGTFDDKGYDEEMIREAMEEALVNKVLGHIVENAVKQS